MVRTVMLGLTLVATSLALPRLASAQQETRTSAAEDPNDKAPQERSFEETRKHMQLHSEWSKQSGKMNDN